MTISISGQVPAEAQNGMYALEQVWTQPRTPDALYAVVKVERAKLHFDDDKQEWTATMKFPAIEPILDPFDVAAAKRLFEDACSARGGAVQPTLDGVDQPADEGGEPRITFTAPVTIVEPEPELTPDDAA